MSSQRKQKTARGHHVIPAHLLAQFALPGQEHKRPRERAIWVYEKGKEPCQRSIEFECKENDYFSTTAADGSRSSEYEEYVNTNVEIPFNDLLRLIGSELYFPSLQHRQIIYKYVANIFNRSKQRREASRINSEEIRAALARIATDEKKVRLITAAHSVWRRQRILISSVKDSLAVLENLSTDSREIRNNFVQGIRELDDQLVDLLKERPYGLLVAPEGKFFVLGDNPVLTRTPYGKGFVVGDGFSKPNVHVLMAISPQLCLQIGLSGPWIRRPSLEELDAINLDIMSLAHRRVYSHDNKKKIQEDMDAFGVTRRYRREAFVRPPLKDEDLLHHVIKTVLHVESAQISELWANVLL